MNTPTQAEDATEGQQAEPSGLPPARMYLRWLRRFLLPIRWLILSPTVEGLENLPTKGPFLVVSNHLSSIDGPAVLLSLPPIDWHFLIAERWRHHWLYGPFLKYSGALFVTGHRVSLSSIRAALQVLDNGGILGVAPEGIRSSTAALIEAQHGAAFLASRANVLLVPVTITGTENARANLLRGRRTRVTVRVSPAFQLSEARTSSRQDGEAKPDLEACTELIMARLAAALPEQYRGVYADRV